MERERERERFTRPRARVNGDEFGEKGKRTFEIPSRRIIVFPDH